MRISSYLKQITAVLQGDEKGVIAAQNERKALSAVKGQIAALEAKQIDDEALVEDAKEAFNQAVYPKTKITDNGVYIRNIINAQDLVDSRQSNLEDTKKTLEYWKTKLTEFTQEADA